MCVSSFKTESITQFQVGRRVIDDIDESLMVCGDLLKMAFLVMSQMYISREEKLTECKG